MTAADSIMGETIMGETIMGETIMNRMITDHTDRSEPSDDAVVEQGDDVLVNELRRRRDLPLEPGLRLRRGGGRSRSDEQGLHGHDPAVGRGRLEDVPHPPAAELFPQHVLSAEGTRHRPTS